MCSGISTPCHVSVQVLISQQMCHQKEAPSVYLRSRDSTKSHSMCAFTVCVCVCVRVCLCVRTCVRVLDKRGGESGFEVFVFSQMSVKGYNVVMDVGARRG